MTKKTKCKHEWRQLLIYTNGNCMAHGGYYCIHCKLEDRVDE